MKNIRVQKPAKGNGYFIVVENERLAVTARELLDLYNMIDQMRQDLIIEDSKIGGE